jgi:hypothetical protein
MKRWLALAVMAGSILLAVGCGSSSASDDPLAIPGLVDLDPPTNRLDAP